MPFLSVGDIMAQPVIAVCDHESIADAYRVMVEKNCRHVPVVNKDREVVGIISDRDLMQAMMGEDLMAIGVAELILLLQDHPVTAVMSSDPETVDIDTPLTMACQLMLDNKFDSLLVLDGERLAGMLTSTDILRAMAGSNLAEA
ncbi:MAG: HPP family protein [Oligoflexus sp.]